jgi:glutaconyl-CoA/methylmalonyl-CoA decarboxylase subunit gamma
MIKKLRVTVDGNTYDVVVELPDDAAAPAVSVGPFAVPSAAPQPVPPVIAPTAPVPAAPASVAPTAPTAAPSGPGDVPSPLAGRVIAVVVTAGQDVKEGDHLLTLEAMKMNTFVFALRAGKVAEIKVAVGAAVEEGQSLVRLD